MIKLTHNESYQSGRATCITLFRKETKKRKSRDKKVRKIKIRRTYGLRKNSFINRGKRLQQLYKINR